MTRTLAPLAQPAPLAAALVMALNDHVFKPAGWPTPMIAGKVSDLAGLFLCPVLLAVIVRAAGGGWRPGACAALTAALFAALKLSPAFNGAIEGLWGVNALDPGDLIALPAAGAAWWWMRRPREARSPRRVLHGGALVAMVLTCAATPAPRYTRDYPRWQIESKGDTRAGCAEASAWVSRSGKTGVGVTLRLRGAAPGGCRVLVGAARLELADGRAVTAAGPAPGELTLAACQTEHVYLPFLFDSEGAWNHGVRAGTFTLALDAGGTAIDWKLRARHVMDGFQRDRFRQETPEEIPPCNSDVKGIAR